MESKFTAGPWKVEEHDGASFVSCGDPNAEWICEAMGGYCKPNARLIAAAPELLKALIDIERILTLPEPATGAVILTQIARRAYKAISKATQEAP